MHRFGMRGGSGNHAICFICLKQKYVVWFLADCGNGSAYPVACLCVCNVGILWLNI